MDRQKRQTKVNSSRRKFLKSTSSCAALAATPMLSQMLSLAMTRSALAAVPQSDYKAIVCLFLSGGNDSFNMLIPNETSEYNDYANVRSGAAIPRNQLSNTAITDRNGRRFAFHPSMPEMRELYDNGSLACVANVGALVEPTTRTQYQNRTVTRPVGIFSHSDQQRAWQTAIPQSRDGLNGWAGRCADLLTDTVNSNPALSMCYSLDGENKMVTGDNVMPYVLDERRGAHVLDGYNGGSTLDRILTKSTDSLVNATYSNLLANTFAQKKGSSIDAAIEYNNQTAGVTLNTDFPDDSLGRELERSIKTVAVQEALGQTRQIFYVSEGGWDHHGNLITGHASRLEKISKAIKAFNDAVLEIGASGKVALFIASDFGRTLTFNGSGSDHAWGGNVMVVGPGVVNGGHVYGSYPSSLATGNPLDIGRGRLLPTTSVDEYYLELASWFGVSPTSTEMQSILPNIRNFTDGSSPPLGFMA